MKKFVLAGAALAAAATPAFADNTLTYNLDAEVSTVCGVYNFQGTSIDVDFGDLASTDTATFVTRGAGSATYRCNDPQGFTRTISSANDGVLLRTGSSGGAANTIPYEMSHGGGSGLGFAFQQLTADVVGNFNGSTAFLNGQTGSVNFRVAGVAAPLGGNESPGTTVFAGDYTDVVTIAVTAN